jgi:cell division protein FtsA
MAKERVIVGLDMGSHRMTAVIGVLDEDEVLEIAGVGASVSQGMRSGAVVNINAALGAIQEAMDSAELDAEGLEVETVLVSFAGGGVEGLNSRGVVAVSGKEGKNEIHPDDVKRVIDAARAVVIPMDREILHVLPKEFIVDDVQGIRDPLEMIGIRLEAEVHIITGSVSATSNLVQCVNRAGYLVSEIVLESLADAYAVLSREEKDVGVVLIDFGAGTTDVVMYHAGAPHFTKVYPIGSERVTKDLAQVLQIPMQEAERIKVQDGLCFRDVMGQDSEVIMQGVGSKPAQAIARSEVCEIIQPRVEEILALILQDLEAHGLDKKLGAGVVLTGGGSRLIGLAEICEAAFRAPARIGAPMRMNGLSEQYLEPEYTTAVGLVKMGAQESNKGEKSKGPPVKGPGFWSRLKEYFKKNWF